MNPILDTIPRQKEMNVQMNFATAEEIVAVVDANIAVINIKKNKMSNKNNKGPQKELKPGELFYKFVLFKLKGHTTWRFNHEGGMREVESDTITEKKELIIDRVTGEVKLKKIK